MYSRAIIRFLASLVLVLTFTAVTAGQAKFSTIHSAHFDIRYIQGVTEADARQILGFLQTDYDTLGSQLGLGIKEKVETRLYDSPGRYRSDVNAGKNVLSASYVGGVMYILTTAPPQGLEKAMRYQLAMAFLGQTAQRSCPEWLREAFAVYHSGIMSDLTPPGSVTVASFSDLTQDLAEARTPSDRNDVNYVLGRTMQFLIERYGMAKAFGVFKEFDGVLPVDKIFKKAFGEESTDVEKAWSTYVALRPRKPK